MHLKPILRFGEYDEDWSAYTKLALSLGGCCHLTIAIAHVLGQKCLEVCLARSLYVQVPLKEFVAVGELKQSQTRWMQVKKW